MIKSDSRRICKGDIFVAIKGIKHDGHDYVLDAIDKGASCVVVEHGNYSVNTIVVDDTREYLKQYVIEQIGEVMKKHGFNVVQSDNLEKTDGRQLFEMDDDSAVDVYVSDNNQVSMRVVGLGFDSNISEKEDEELFQKQVSFCTQHPQIMRDLERRGVKLSTVVHRPPSKKFNTKIATKSTTGRGNRAKREEKKIGNRTLYKE